MYMFSLNELVTASKTDENNKLKTVSMINLMQDCSQMWLQSENELNDYFNQNNISQLLVFRQLDILNRPVYGDRLKVSTSIFECRSAYGFRNTVIYNEQGDACIKSWSMGAFVSLDTNNLARIPKEILENVNMDEKVEMEYCDRKILLENCYSEKLLPVKVMRNDIDGNHHMNNAQYVRIAIECIPEDYDYNRLCIEYKRPAIKGNLIYPTLKIFNDKRIIVVLSDEKNQPYALLEFSLSKRDL